MSTSAGGAARLLAVRPLEVGDLERLARMVGRLSPESIRFRFFAPIPRLSRSTLLGLADVDRCHRDALVALDGDEILAAARYSGLPEGSGRREAEIAVTVWEFSTAAGAVVQRSETETLGLERQEIRSRTFGSSGPRRRAERSCARRNRGREPQVSMSCRQNIQQARQNR